MTPESVLNILRKDARNHITSFHRWMAPSRSPADTAGVTLNYHDPYYEGWAPALEMQETFISMSVLHQISDKLVVEKWGNRTIGGKIYRLKADGGDS